MILFMTNVDKRVENAYTVTRTLERTVKIWDLYGFKTFIFDKITFTRTLQRKMKNLNMGTYHD